MRVNPSRACASGWASWADCPAGGRDDVVGDLAAPLVLGDERVEIMPCGAGSAPDGREDVGFLEFIGEKALPTRNVLLARNRSTTS